MTSSKYARSVHVRRWNGWSCHLRKCATHLPNRKTCLGSTTLAWSRCVNARGTVKRHNTRVQLKTIDVGTKRLSLTHRPMHACVMTRPKKTRAVLKHARALNTKRRHNVHAQWKRTGVGTRRLSKTPKPMPECGAKLTVKTHAVFRNAFVPSRST